MAAGVSTAPAPAPLTQRQHNFMLALQRRMAANPDCGVSYDELRQDLGLRSKSGVSRLVEECVARGRVARIPRSSRSLRIIAPVSENDVVETGETAKPIIHTFSDSEILMEAARRGLISASS